MFFHLPYLGLAILILIWPFLLESIPVTLSFDEAHYALYGYYLSLSYFDHPPLIGWLQSIFQKLLGTSDWAIRSPAVLCGLITLTMLYRALPTFTRPRGLICIASAPLFFLLSVGFLPDTLLLVLVFPVLIFTKRVCTYNRSRDWLFLSIALACAFMAKYTAVFFAFSAVLYIVQRRSLKIFKQWHKLIPGIIVGLVILSPLLWWNLQHDFISFRYQLQHGFGGESISLKNILLAQFMQIFSYGPLLYIGMISSWQWLLAKFLNSYSAHKKPIHPKLLALYKDQQKAIIKRKEFYKKYDIYFYFALPPLCFFIFSPAFGRFLPHWLAYPYLLLIIPIAVSVYEKLFTTHKTKQTSLSYNKNNRYTWNQRFLVFIIGLSLIWSMGIRAMTLGWLPLSITSFNIQHPLEQAYGWQELAHDLKSLSNNRQQSWSQSKLNSDHVLFATNWSYAAQLAWYMRPTPVIVLDNRFHQYTLWFGSPQENQSGLLVVPAWERKNINILENFRKCTFIAKKDSYLHELLVSSFDIYQCEHLIVKNYR